VLARARRFAEPVRVSRPIEADRDEPALVYLKRALAQEPDNARLLYLLGAVHAEIDMTDRAIAEMSRAVELDPGFAIPHFQLGMLHLRRDELDQARQAWRPLDELGADDALRAFKSGLVHLIDDDYAGCIAELRRGLAFSDHAPLNEDMRRILDDAEATLAAAQRPGEGAVEPAPAPADSRHVLLAGYDQP
jgi:tetratricopeptide (TPR) repeat protein